MPTKRNKLCTSLLPSNDKELKEWLSNAIEGDFLEIRADHIPRISWARTLKNVDTPIIATLRTKSQGGFWEGSDAEYLKFAKAACKAEVAYVDIEFASAKCIDSLPKDRKTKVILSYHTRDNDAEKLTAILEEMLEVKADVYKLIYTAQSLNDSLIAKRLIKKAKLSKVKYVIHGMDDDGKLSRIMGALDGNEWTYVANAFDKTTASGQLTLLEASNYFNIPEKRNKTRVLGLIGSPIHQSKGWRLHNDLIAQHLKNRKANDPDYIYLNFHVEELESFWEKWHPHLHGLSVTIPHKETIVPFLDDFTTEVKISGVCNTLIKTSKGWTGHNTDFLALQALLTPVRHLLGSGALVIGTGATARSAIAALKRLDIKPVFVVGRNQERGNLLSEKLGIDFLLESEVHYAGVSGIIQTTPVGMVPYTDRYPTGTSHFRRERVVLDVIYNPPVTRFLQIAQDRGCRIISGVDMFLLQAAKQFEIFTGQSITPEDVERAYQRIGI